MKVSELNPLNSIKFESSRYVSWIVYLPCEITINSSKKIFTNGKSVKTIQQSNDLIGLESNCRLKKLTDSNAHNTIKTIKTRCKRNSCLINVMGNLLHRGKWLRSGLVNLNEVVRAQMILNDWEGQITSPLQKSLKKCASS